MNNEPLATLAIGNYIATAYVTGSAKTSTLSKKYHFTTQIIRTSASLGMHA